jgi:hypothetical protein
MRDIPSSLSELQQIDPYKFEHLIGKLWQKKGYSTNVRQQSGDRGIDVVATDGSEKVLIQAKRYTGKNKVGSQEVRKYATLYQQVSSADEVCIVTTGLFTNEARKLAIDLNVSIFNGEDVIGLLQSHSESIAIDTDLSANVDSVSKSAKKAKLKRERLDPDRNNMYSDSITERKMRTPRSEGNSQSAEGTETILGGVLRIIKGALNR